MFTFSNPNITVAPVTAIPTITALLNSAYRGESSKLGWTNEAHLISGDVRTNNSSVLEVMEMPGSVVLQYANEQQQIIGCVNLQLQGDKIYLGMFSVSPVMQGAGIGKAILQAAEEYAAQMKCSLIYMTVIAAREDLINWYKRHGYKDTGVRKEFIEDAVSGPHLQPLAFMVLEKTI